MGAAYQMGLLPVGLEALDKAKKDGKVKYVGFTGHKNPSIHLAMLKGGFPFDTVQMPLNPFDYSYRSFQREVLPVAAQRGMAVFGMKSMGGTRFSRAARK